MKKKFERRLLDKDADFARFAEPILQDERYRVLRDIPHHAKHHATKHGVYAAVNALKDFGLNAVERNAIESHMWPVCLFTLPLFRESWIVQLADKRVTWKEFLARFAKKKAA